MPLGDVSVDGAEIQRSREFPFETLPKQPVAKGQGRLRFSHEILKRMATRDYALADLLGIYRHAAIRRYPQSLQSVN